MAIDTPKIAFFDARDYDRESFNRENGGYGFPITYFRGHLTADTVRLAEGADTVCAFVNDSLDAAVMDALAGTGVRLAAMRCAGYNNVDLKAAFGRVHVVRVPAYSPHAVAEHALALMMALNRKTHKAFYRTRDNNFTINGLLGFDMYGKTAGVVGTGKIGRILIGILNGLGMEVLAYDPFPDDEFAATGACRYVALDELLGAADVVSLHCPLTPDTHHLINAERIGRMKPGVMLINTGRGRLIDSPALVEGLKDGRIGAAGLDVYEEESEYFFEDFSASVIGDDVLARLMSFGNVLITAHQGFFTREALANIASVTLENIRAFFEDGTVENEVCYRCDRDACARAGGEPCF